MQRPAPPRPGFNPTTRTCRRTRQALFATEDTAAYVVKCKSLTYCSFVVDLTRSAIAKSIKADIFAFENEGE